MFNKALIMPAEGHYILILRGSGYGCELPQHKRSIKNVEENDDCHQETDKFQNFFHALVSTITSHLVDKAL